MKGFFVRCLDCTRIVIYGQTCVCGNRTNGQGTRKAADAASYDAGREDCRR